MAITCQNKAIRQRDCLMSSCTLSLSSISLTTSTCKNRVRDDVINSPFLSSFYNNRMATQLERRFKETNDITTNSYLVRCKTCSIKLIIQVDTKTYYVTILRSFLPALPYTADLINHTFVRHTHDIPLFSYWPLRIRQNIINTIRTFSFTCSVLRKLSLPTMDWEYWNNDLQIQNKGPVGSIWEKKKINVE